MKEKTRIEKLEERRRELRAGLATMGTASTEIHQYESVLVTLTAEGARHTAELEIARWRERAETAEAKLRANLHDRVESVGDVLLENERLKSSLESAVGATHRLAETAAKYRDGLDEANRRIAEQAARYRGLGAFVHETVADIRLQLRAVRAARRELRLSNRRDLSLRLGEICGNVSSLVEEIDREVDL